MVEKKTDFQDGISNIEGPQNSYEEINKLIEEIEEFIKKYNYGERQTITKANSILGKAIRLFIKTMPDIEKIDGESQNTLGIRLKDSNEKESFIPLKPKLNSKGTNYKLKKGDTIISVLARLTHIMNRFAHTYNDLIEKEIFNKLYNNTDVKFANKRKKKSFIEIIYGFENYCESYKEVNCIGQRRSTLFYKRKKLDEELGKNNLTFDYDTYCIEKLVEMIELKKKCYEIKNRLIALLGKKCKQENKKIPDKYSYGTQMFNKNGTEGENSEQIFIINIPSYGQFIFHIIDQAIYNAISETYNENLPYIGRDYYKNIKRQPVPTYGLSEDLKKYIDINGGIENVIDQIAQNGQDLKTRKSTIFNILLNQGMEIKEIEDYLSKLQIFMDEKSNRNRE